MPCTRTSRSTLPCSSGGEAGDVEARGRGRRIPWHGRPRHRSRHRQYGLWRSGAQRGAARGARRRAGPEAAAAGGRAGGGVWGRGAGRLVALAGGTIETAASLAAGERLAIVHARVGELIETYSPE